MVLVQTPIGSNGVALPAIYLGGATAVVSYDGSVQSAALAEGMYRFIATTDCHVASAVNPTATTSDALLKAGVEYFFAVRPSFKVAAIKASGSSAGALYITAAG